MPAASGLRLGRLLTHTALAREHELLLRQPDRRKRIAIPWAQFQRARYPALALALGYQYMRHLAVGEYLAVDSFARVVSALTLSGAPLDLVAAAARIPSDEIRHCDLALRMAALCGGRPLAEVSAEITVEELAERERAYAGRPRTLADLDLWMAEVPAFGETLACALLMECRRGASDVVARAFFSSLVGDEVRHARLGWYYLAWRSPQWTRAERQRVANRAGEVVQDAMCRFGRGTDPPPGSRRAARALGLLDRARQRLTVERVMEREIVPAFDALGLGASHAWRTAR